MRNSVHIIKDSLSEAALFSFQEAMLTKGIHHISFPCVHIGRTLLYSFLRVLFPFKNSGCLTTSSLFLEPYIVNIYYRLLEEGCGNGTEHSLADFFYSQCNFDFMWIEKNKNTADFLIENFESMIMSYKLDNDIPIMVVCYDKTC